MNLGYSLSSGSVPILADGQGGAFSAWYRVVGSAVSPGTMHVQRFGADPPSIAVATVPVGSPSIATVGNVTATFASVTTSGQLYLDLTTGPQLPAGMQGVPAATPNIYELSTSATFTGDVDVCIEYDPTQVTSAEDVLRILHYENVAGIPTWVDVTTNVDANANRICGQTTSLSPFAIVEPVTTDAIATAPALRLHQNHPNPFNPSTMIRYEIPARGRVRLNVYDVRGRLVRTLANGEQDAGPHQVVWMGDDVKGRRVASGVYLYRLETPNESLRRRMVLVR
jgi:hypothetical protein